VVQEKNDLCAAELWTGREAAAADRYTMGTLGMDSAVLVERASLCVSAHVEAILSLTDDLCRVMVLCGSGNNGADGLAVARQLHGRGYMVEAVCVTDGAGEMAARQRAWAQSHGVTVLSALPEHPSDSVLVVDALLGTGSRGAPRGAILAAIGWILETDWVVSIDLPTGVNPDDGTCPGDAVTAASTVTFERSKVGLHVGVGREQAGRVHVAEIGLELTPDQPTQTAELIDPRRLFRIGRGPTVGHLGVEFLTQTARHKGERGHVGLIAGSPGSCGAAILAGAAALRMGAGVVTIVAADRAAEETATHALLRSRPEVMVEVRAIRGHGKPLDGSLAAAADVLVVGPGLRDLDAWPELGELYLDDSRPAVWDASALDAIPLGAGRDQLAAVGSRRILTPHPGEAARLLTRIADIESSRSGGGAEDTEWSSVRVQASRLEVVRRLARFTGATVILKGAGSLVVSSVSGSDLSPVAVDIFGSSALATAGTGDVLAGLLGALLSLSVRGGRGETLHALAMAGLVFHGLAGREAARQGQVLAMDVASALRRVRGALAESMGVGSVEWPLRIKG